MRELSECTAEVFRRSDERIKRIKNVRKCVMAVCVPLCLFAVVMSAVFLPSVSNMAKKSEYGSDSGYYCSVVKAEIKGAGVSRTVEDMDEALNIYFAVSDMFNDGEIKEKPSATEDMLSGGETEDQSESVELDMIVYSSDLYSWEYKYDIIFYTESGDESVYTLCGNDLTDHATGETLTLTDEQTETLRGMIDTGRIRIKTSSEESGLSQ